MDGLVKKQIAVFGAGNIGRILLKHLREYGVPAAHLMVCDANNVRCAQAATEYGSTELGLTDQKTHKADLFLLCTPPATIADVLKVIKERLHPGQVVISFAAAVSLSRLEALVPPGVGVARIMPNAPSLVGQGMNPVVYGKALRDQDKELVEELLATLGDSLEVDDEQMNWCVGLNGAAMRSVLPALEGMTRAGLEAGFDERQARRLAAQVMLGTAELALQTSLTYDEIKSLTPMETLDEVAIAKAFQDAARGAKDKIDHLEQKLWSNLGMYHD